MRGLGEVVIQRGLNDFAKGYVLVGCEVPKLLAKLRGDTDGEHVVLVDRRTHRN